MLSFFWFPRQLRGCIPMSKLHCIIGNSPNLPAWFTTKSCCTAVASFLSRSFTQRLFARMTKLDFHTTFPAQKTLHSRLELLSPPVFMCEKVATWFLEKVKRVHRARKSTFMWTSCDPTTQWYRPPFQSMCTLSIRRQMFQNTSRMVPQTSTRCSQWMLTPASCKSVSPLTKLNICVSF